MLRNKAFSINLSGIFIMKLQNNIVLVYSISNFGNRAIIRTFLDFLSRWPVLVWYRYEAMVFPSEYFSCYIVSTNTTVTLWNVSFRGTSLIFDIVSSVQSVCWGRGVDVGVRFCAVRKISGCSFVCVNQVTVSLFQLYCTDSCVTQVIAFLFQLYW